MDNSKLSESIIEEISKGRTFEEILNETPKEDCSYNELTAWLDAGEIVGKQSPNNFRLTKIKVNILELLLTISTTLLLVSPFIIQNKIFLLMNIPLGVLIGMMGRTNTRLYSTIEMKVELKELIKHLTIKGYTKRVLIKDFIIKLIFTPLHLVVLGCEVIFPAFKK